MTGAELKTFTESILDGLTIDETLFYQLLNVAKTKLEEQRVWQYLKKLDSSYSAPIDRGECYPIDFEEQHLFRSHSNRYYVDLAGNQIVFTKDQTNFTLPDDFAEDYKMYIGTDGIINFFYKRFTPELTEDTSPVFPSRFQPLLGFYVAGYYQGGIDSDDIFARMSPVNKLAAMELQKAMEAWDTSLKLRSQNNQVGVANSQPEISLSDM